MCHLIYCTCREYLVQASVIKYKHFFINARDPVTFQLTLLYILYDTKQQHCCTVCITTQWNFISHLIEISSEYYIYCQKKKAANDLTESLRKKRDFVPQGSLQTLLLAVSFILNQHKDVNFFLFLLPPGSHYYIFYDDQVSCNYTPL